MNYANTASIVTGAASGIGRALALEMTRRGSKVYGFDRDGKGLSETTRLAKALGAFEPFAHDVREAARWQELVDRIVATDGRIDFVFNNAGWSSMGFDWDVSLEDWREVVDTNLMGTVYGIHAVYPHMMKQGRGYIVNTASLGGIIPIPGAASYVASKFAVVGLSHAIRAELAPHGVQVNVVCPAAVDTNIDRNSKWNMIDRQRFLDARPKGSISADQCAVIILRGVERNQRTISPGPAGIMGRAYHLLPWLVGKVITTFARQLAVNRRATLAELEGSSTAKAAHR